MSNRQLHRRTFLALAGTATTIGLAGCSMGSANDQPDESDHSETEDGHSDDQHEVDHSGDEGDDGHGSGNGHGHDDTIDDPADLAEVSMTTTGDGEHFEPHVVRVTIGGTVRWTNDSGMHSTIAYAPANDKPRLVPEEATPWDSGLLTEAGASFEHTFETQGVYHYYCAPHETVGMIGSVIVGEPDAHGQPALEEPPEDMPEQVRQKLTELNEMCNEALGHGH